MISKKIICIRGQDGTGKSTLIKKLSKVFSDVYVATIWDLFSASENTSLFKSKKDIDNYLCALTSGSRTLFLMHALKFSVDKACQSNSHLIIFDSYYYKYILSELALGANKEFVNNLIKEFPNPDLIIELRLPISVTARRKKYFSRYECGLIRKPDKEGFIKFQKQIRMIDFNFEDKNVKILSSELSSDEVFNKAKEYIDAEIKKN